MNCSGPDFLTIRERSCFQLDNGKYIVKHPLFKTLIDWYLLIDEDDRICDDQHRLLKEFINAIIYNLTKP
ncbi:unnamed protein product, partial [Rotaria sp. Silwood1]